LPNGLPIRRVYQFRHTSDPIDSAPWHASRRWRTALAVAADRENKDATKIGEGVNRVIAFGTRSLR
jgi:hypothetical protein